MNWYLLVENRIIDWYGTNNPVPHIGEHIFTTKGRILIDKVEHFPPGFNPRTIYRSDYFDHISPDRDWHIVVSGHRDVG